MPIHSSRSLQLLKGGLVAYQLLDLLPAIVVFPCDPEEMTHTLQGPAGGGGRTRRASMGRPNRSSALRWISTDQLEQPQLNVVTVQNGLHPIIAAPRAAGEG